MNGRPATSDGVSTRSPTTTVCASSASVPGHGPVPVTPGRAAAHRGGAGGGARVRRGHGRLAEHARAVVEHGRLPGRDAAQRAGHVERDSTPPSRTAPAPGTAAPCARTCSAHVERRRRRRRTRRRGPPRRPATARSSADPTTTRLFTGSTESTYRGFPSAAGRPIDRPRRCPTVYAYAPSCVPEHGAGRVDDLARLRPEPRAQEALGVAVGDEADVVGVRLGGHATARGRRPRRGSPPWRRRRRAGTSTRASRSGPITAST